MDSSAEIYFLVQKKRQIFIFDGDGNILMNLSSLVTIGSLQPKNLIHIIYDNKTSVRLLRILDSN